MKQVITLLLIFISSQGFGQEDAYLRKIGALSNRKYTTKDTVLINKLNTTAKDSVYNNSSKAEKYSRIALSIASKLEYYHGKFEAVINLSRAKIYLNDMDSAMFYADYGLSIAETTKSNDFRVRSYEMKGNVNTYTGDYKTAVTNYLTGAKIGEKHDPKLSLTCYTNLGLVFMKTKNIEKAEHYINLSIKLGEKYNDPKNIASSLNNLGLVEKSRGNLDLALKHYERGLKLARESKYEKRESEILHNMANIFFKKQDFEKGFEYFDKSVEISRKNGSFSSLAIDYYTLALNFTDTGEFKRAEEAAFIALDYATKSKNKEIITECYAMISHLYYEIGNNDQAFSYLSYAYVYKDSLNLININNTIVDAEAKYEKEKQKIESDLKLANEKKVNIEKIWWRDLFLWISIVIILGVIVGIYYLIRINKQVKLKNQTVEKQKEEITEQHLEIKSSIDYAKRIQIAMFSAKHQWDKISENNSIFFRPKDVVSGDFYWAHKNEEKNTSIWAVADCTGHGVPGAFMSMLGIGFLNEIVIETAIMDPGEILNQLRSKIVASLDKEDSNNKDGMDIAICTYNHSTNTLLYAGANNPLWIITNQAPLTHLPYKSVLPSPDNQSLLLEIAPDKMPIGKLFSIPPPFTTKEIKINNGDKIILFSDGFADQFGGDSNKKFKYKSLKELLLETHSSPYSEHAHILGKHFDNWKGNENQTDDVCIVSVEITK